MVPDRNDDASAVRCVAVLAAIQPPFDLLLRRCYIATNPFREIGSPFRVLGDFGWRCEWQRYHSSQVDNWKTRSKPLGLGPIRCLVNSVSAEFPRNWVIYADVHCPEVRQCAGRDRPRDTASYVPRSHCHCY